MIRRHLLPLAALLILGGCYSPSGWSMRLEERVGCGMTVEEVQALTNRRVEKLEFRHAAQPWATHYIVGRWEQPEFSLGFEKGRLRFVQVSWNNNMMSVASYPVIDLCLTEGAESSVPKGTSS